MPQLSRRTLLSLAAFSPLALTVAGCGGGGSDASDSPGPDDGSSGAARSATFTINWNATSGAAPTRVPAATTHVRVDLFDGATFLKAKVAKRPTGSNPSPSTLAFTELPIATLSAKVGAFSKDPGEAQTATALPLASATVLFTPSATNATSVPVTLQSVIATLKAETNIKLLPRETKRLNVTAQDAAGVDIVLSADRLRFASDRPEIVSVVAAGNLDEGLPGTTLTAGLPGTAVITIRDEDSGKQTVSMIEVSNTLGKIKVTLTNPPSGTRRGRVELKNSAIGQTKRWDIDDGVEREFEFNAERGDYILRVIAFYQGATGDVTLNQVQASEETFTLGAGETKEFNKKLTSRIALLKPVLVSASQDFVLVGGRGDAEDGTATVVVQATLTDAAPVILDSGSFDWRVKSGEEAGEVDNADNKGYVTTKPVDATTDLFIEITEPRSKQTVQGVVKFEVLAPKSGTASGTVR